MTKRRSNNPKKTNIGGHLTVVNLAPQLKATVDISLDQTNEAETKSMVMEGNGTNENMDNSRSFNRKTLTASRKKSIRYQQDPSD